MRPPRSDRPRGARPGGKPFQKADRPQAAGSAPRGAGGGERAFGRPAGKQASGGSHAASAGTWRDSGKDRVSGKPQGKGAGKPGEGRAERPFHRSEPPQGPSRIQDRARDSLTRERGPRPIEPRKAESRQSDRPTESRSAEPRSAEPRAAAAPRGAVWLYGLHAVQAALANPERQFRRLVTTEEGAAQLAARLRRRLPIEPEMVDRARLDHLLGRDAVHQGIALLCDLLPQLTFEEAFSRPGPILMLDQVTDPRNIGAILRSAAAFGAACVILQDRHAPEETGSLAKAASGALETVPLLRAVNLARTIAQLKSADCWVVGLDAEATAALSGPSFAGRRVALVLGAEGEGLRRLTRESCDELAMLPMPGEMESLNVSAATAVALYELTRKA